MATLKELSETMAQATGWAHEDLANRARLLREAGLLPRSKQGKGATHYSPRDAAKVLMAMLATSNPTRASLAVKECKALKQTAIRTLAGYTLKQQDCLPPILRDTTFENALTALLEQCMSSEGRNEIQGAVLSIQVKRSPSVVTLAVIDFLTGRSAENPQGSAWELVFFPRDVKREELREIEGSLRIRINHKKWSAAASTTGEVLGAILPIVGELLARDQNERWANSIPWPYFGEAA